MNLWEQANRRKPRGDGLGLEEQLARMRALVDELQKSCQYHSGHKNIEGKKRIKQSKLADKPYCYVCGAGRGSTLFLHHRHYETAGMETPDDLVLLCYRCHSLVHTLRSEWRAWIKHFTYIPHEDNLEDL